MMRRGSEVRRRLSDPGFGFVSGHQRRQAELFFADLIGAPPGRRPPTEEVAGLERSSERDLTAAEKTAGAHTVTWNGSATAGSLAGGVATPAFSPYTVTIVATTGPSNTGAIAIEVHDIEVTTTAPASDRLNMSHPTDA